MPKGFQAGILFIWLAFSYICVLGVAKEADPEIAKLLSQYERFSGMNMSSLTIATPPNEDCALKFIHGNKLSIYLSLLAATGSFVIRNQRVNILEVSPDKDTIFGSRAQRVQGLSFNKDFLIGGVKQWKLVLQENFWSQPYGWSMNEISTCGGINMLGGYGKFAGGEVTKVFADLPPHTMIRVVATYHFIDSWNGESAFMRLGIGKNKALEYVWTDVHDFSKGSKTISVCGARYPENRLSTPIDVMAPHIDDFIEVGFGSTLDQDPYENSFGVSGLQIFVR